MDTAVRIGLIVLAIGVVLGLLAPMIGKVGEGLAAVASALPSVVSFITPYLKFGKEFLNLLMGSSTVVNVMLWFVLLSPFTMHSISLIVKIYRKFTS